MLFSKMSLTRGNLIRGAAAGAILLLPLLGAGDAAASGMGDPSAALRRNEAAYPNYFRVDPNGPDTQTRICSSEPSLSASDPSCRQP